MLLGYLFFKLPSGSDHGPLLAPTKQVSILVSAIWDGLAGVADLSASPGHLGRRRIVLGHTRNTQTLTKANELKKKGGGPCIIFIMSYKSLRVCVGPRSKPSWAAWGLQAVGWAKLTRTFAANGYRQTPLTHHRGVCGPAGLQRLSAVGLLRAPVPRQTQSQTQKVDCLVSVSPQRGQEAPVPRPVDGVCDRPANLGPAGFTQSGDYLLHLTDSADIHKPKSEPRTFSHLVSCDLKPLTISAGCVSADRSVMKSSRGPEHPDGHPVS